MRNKAADVLRVNGVETPSASASERDAYTGSGLRVLLLSPWGASGGYSGPLTLMNRMWSEVVKNRPETRVTLVYRDRGVDSSPTWAADTIAAVRSRGFGRLAQMRWMLAAAACVLRRRRSVDVVHLQGAYLANLVPALFARRGRVVILPVLEDGDLGGLRNSVIKRWIARRVGASALSAFALSDGIVGELRYAGVDAHRVGRLSNPVDPRMLRADPQTHWPRDTVRLGFVGKLGPLKNPHLLIEVAAALRDIGRPCEVHFIGPFASPEMEQQLRHLAAKRRVQDGTHFHGFQSDVLPAFKCFDIFVLPSTQEGLPGSLMEAFAMGKPVVVTDVGSMAEYVHIAGAGRIVRAQTDEIVEAILDLDEPSAWTAAARGARSYASAHLDPKVIANHYLRQIERAAR